MLVRCLRPEDDAPGSVGQEESGNEEESTQGASTNSSDARRTCDTSSTIALDVVDERMPPSSSSLPLGAIRRERRSSKRASTTSEAQGEFFEDEMELSPMRSGAENIAASAGFDTIQEPGFYTTAAASFPLLTDMARLALHGSKAKIMGSA